MDLIDLNALPVHVHGRVKALAGGVVVLALMLTSVFPSAALVLVFCITSSVIGGLFAHFAWRRFTYFPSIWLPAYARKAAKAAQAAAAAAKAAASQSLGQAPSEPVRKESAFGDKRPVVLVPRKFNARIEGFIDRVLDEFVWSWYKDVSTDVAFVEELRQCFTHAFLVLADRLVKINLPEFVIRRVIPAFIEYLDAHSRAATLMRRKDPAAAGKTIVELTFAQLGAARHHATLGSEEELAYLRHFAHRLLPLLFPAAVCSSKATLCLVREIVAGSLLKPALQSATNPDLLNRQLINALADDPPGSLVPISLLMAGVEYVPLLRGYGETKAYATSLGTTLPNLLSSREMLFAFMKFMEAQEALPVLQFCLTVETYNEQVSQGAAGRDEVSAQAKDIFQMYIAPEGVSSLGFPQEMVDGVREAISRDASAGDNVPGTRTSALPIGTCLLRPYNHAYQLLEARYFPLFLQSDLYFELVCNGGKLTGVSDAHMGSLLGSRKGAAPPRRQPTAAAADKSKRTSMAPSGRGPSGSPATVRKAPSAAQSKDPSAAPSTPEMTRAVDAAHLTSSLTSSGQKMLADALRDANASDGALSDASRTASRAPSPVPPAALAASAAPVPSAAATAPSATPSGPSSPAPVATVSSVTAVPSGGAAAAPSVSSAPSSPRPAAAGRAAAADASGESAPASGVDESSGDELASRRPPRESRAVGSMAEGALQRPVLPLQGGDHLRVDMGGWEVHVVAHEAVGHGAKRHVEYIIEVVRHDGPRTPQSHWTTPRRYNDFDALHNRLKETHESLADVDLPGKRAFGNFDRAFLDGRMRALDNYLQFLLSHASMCQDPVLYAFLQPTDEFARMLRSEGEGLGSSDLGRFLKSVPSKLKKMDVLLPFHSENLAPEMPTSVVAMRQAAARMMTSASGAEGGAAQGTKRALAQAPSYNADVAEVFVDEVSSPAERIEIETVADAVAYFILRLTPAVKHRPWLRSALSALRVAAANTLDDFAEWKMQTKIERYTTEKELVELMDIFEDAVFGDAPVRTEEDLARTREQCLADLLSFFPEPLQMVVGRSAFREGLIDVFNVLQQPELTKHMLYVILDLAFAELFPELKGDAGVAQ